MMDVTSSRLAVWALVTQTTKTLNWPTSYSYDAIIWPAFCAAVESGDNSADMAWSKVFDSITNLNTWKAGVRTYPRFNRRPRNK